MVSMPLVKICGITAPDALEASISHGADFIGFNFYKPSPRYLPAEIAGKLTKKVPTSVRSVGLFVDATDEYIDTILGCAHLDMIQLHGDESRTRVAEIRMKYNLPVIKAVRIRDAGDLEKIKDYTPVAEWLLLDSRPPGHDLPGGTGHRFDWNMLAGYKKLPEKWFLAGGLDENNVWEAVEKIHPPGLDVSSGVESGEGIKDPEKIKNFINNTKMKDGKRNVQTS